MSEENVIKYVSKENLSTLYKTIDSRLKDPIRVNNQKADSSGNITIDSIGYADEAGRARVAAELESVTMIEQTDSFILRPSGGDEDIFTGEAILKEIHGNSRNIEAVEASIYDLSNGLSFDQENIGSSIIIDAITFNNKLLNCKKDTTNYPNFDYDTNINFVVTFSNATWKLSQGTSVLLSNFSIQDWGISIINDGNNATILENSSFSFKLNPGQNAAHNPFKIKKFTSIGFNLLNNDGVADLIGGQAYVVRAFNGSSGSEKTFTLNSTTGNDYSYIFQDTNGSAISLNIENYELYTKKIPNTFIAPCDGSFKLIVPSTDSCMVNFIWSGKRLTDKFEAYSSNNITFTSDPNKMNEVEIELDRINNSYDTFDLLTGTVTKNIATFNITNRIADTVFARIDHIKDGNNYIYDVRSCEKAYGSEPWTNNSLPSLPNDSTPSNWNNLRGTPSIITYYIKNDDSKYSLEPYKYDVNDFGMEKITGGYYFPEGEKHPLETEGKFIYSANLIDKLRRNVVTYTLQPDISDSGRSNARQNLDLINVNCYVGPRAVAINIDKVDNDNNIIESLKTIYTEKENKTVTIKLSSLGRWKFSSNIDGVKVTEYIQIDYYGNYSVKLAGKRFGFRRKKTTVDPKARITYLFDAADYLPVQFNGEEFDYGSWKTFVEEVSAPYVYDGTGFIALDRNNQSKLEDGYTDKSINSNYNYLTGFRKYKYVARKSDENYDYVIFSDEDLSNDGEGFEYSCQAHSYYTGENQTAVSDIFYWGMFPGSYVTADKVVDGQTVSETKLRSNLWTSSDFANRANSNIGTMLQDAKNNGDRWSIGYKAGWDYICDLITLITKTDNAQEIFGTGNFLNNGVLTALEYLDSKPGFIKGNGSYTRIFWIYDFYGRTREPLLGFIQLNTGAKNWGNCYYYVKSVNSSYPSNYFKVVNNSFSLPVANDLKNTDKYFSDLGYIKVGSVYNGNSNWISAQQKMDSINGFIPIELNGGDSTKYIPDYVAQGSDANTARYATFGYIAGTAAASSQLLQNGPRALDFTILTNNGTAASTVVLPRLTYIG